MPDYSMCVDNKCIYRMDCARYLMIPNTYQTVTAFVLNSKGICDGWWPIEDAPFRCYSVEEAEVFEASWRELGI